MVVTAKVIERLRENDDVSNWVSQGLELNKKYKNKVCEFCGNIISQERIEELEAHFNDEVSKTKQELEKLPKELEIYNIKENEIIMDKSLFYKEKRTKIELLNNNILEALLKLDGFIKNIKKNIEEKKNNPFKKIELNEIENAKGIIKNYNSCIMIQEQYVKETNDKSINFEKESKEIKSKIKNAGNSLNQTSEYEYEFETVYKMKDKELGESDIFNCGNACRKLLEAFLSFKFPRQRGNILSLLEKAFPDEDEIQNKNRVYKFINEYSHLNVIESTEISDIDTSHSNNQDIS